MNNLISRCKKAISGVINGFDRLIFHGFIRPLMYPEGAMGFFDRKRIFYKDARPWMEAQTHRIIDSVEKYSVENTGKPITRLTSWRENKKDIARERQKEMEIDTGLIGVWSCMEGGNSYRIIPADKKPALRRVNTHCKHLYIYLDHAEYGFMNIRIQTVMDASVRHAFISGHAGRVIRYFGKPVNKYDQPRSNFSGTIQTKTLETGDGFRIKHRIDSNSVKLYNEFRTMRIETTINNPYAFRVHRHKEGATKDEPKKRMPLRKDVADIALRAQISQDINNRFSEHIATADSGTPLHEVLKPITHAKIKNGRRVRGLEPTGKDREILKAISDPRFAVSGFTNKALRQLLCDNPLYAHKTDKQLSGMITRLIRLLRDHSMIRKYPKQHRYQLTTSGRQITTVVQVALAASTGELMEIAA